MSKASSASLEVAAISIPQRPEPPKSLSKRQADIWREIVATKPPDWFEADTRPILEAYCKAIDWQARMSKELERAIAGEGGFAACEKLYAITEKNVKLLAQLATKMRLTPQSRYTPKAAARQINAPADPRNHGRVKR